MTRSDSKIDLATYKPSVEDARRLADEEAAQERLKRALDNPALDAALAEVRAAPGKVRGRVSKPSPWAKGATPGSEKIDKAALPSATAPTAPPENVPVNAEGRRSWSWTWWSKALAAIGLALLPALIVFVLLVKPQPPDGRRDAGATTSAATPMPTMSAPFAAAPPASAGPSAQEEAGSAAPTTSAAPSAAAPAPERPHGVPKRPTGSDDPYRDAAVAPVPTATAVAPIPTPTAETHPTSAVKPPEPVPQPPASSSAGFQYFRKHD
jgi:hypothetical protein